MFQKYRMYCYILRKGEVSEEELIRRFHITGEYLVDLYGIRGEGTELHASVGMISLGADGIEYIASVRRSILFCALPVLAALLPLFLSA